MPLQGSLRQFATSVSGHSGTLPPPLLINVGNTLKICQRHMNQRLTFALAFFGSSAHERNQRVFVSSERTSRWVNPRKECSPSIGREPRLVVQPQPVLLDAVLDPRTADATAHEA